MTVLFLLAMGLGQTSTTRAETMMYFQLASVGAAENIEITAHEAVTMVGDVRIRPPTVRDAGAIARLYSISSDGVADYIWTEMAGRGEDPLTVGEFAGAHTLEQIQVLGYRSVSIRAFAAR